MVFSSGLRLAIALKYSDNFEHESKSQTQMSLHLIKKLSNLKKLCYVFVFITTCSVCNNLLLTRRSIDLLATVNVQTDRAGRLDDDWQIARRSATTGYSLTYRRRHNQGWRFGHRLQRETRHCNQVSCGCVLCRPPTCLVRRQLN